VRIFRGIEEIKGIKNAVVTTGSFDGVHIGHFCIIQRLNRLAEEINGESVLVTFCPHPRKILFPETAGKDLKLINSQREKIELLAKTGLQNLVIIDFTIAFSKTSSEDFIREVLVKKINAKKVVIGFNHHFGHHRKGDFSDLYRLGKEFHFDVEEIPEQDIHNEAVSSTKVRQALTEGNIQKANAYLDHHYVITGQARKLSKKEHNTYQWYDINIEEDCKLIPPTGLYATFMYYKGQQHKGMVEIQYFNDPSSNSCSNKRVLLNNIGIDDDIHGKIITIYFASKVLPQEGSNTYTENEYTKTRSHIEELIY